MASHSVARGERLGSRRCSSSKQLAVALQYEEGADGAPVVMAVGEQRYAEQILRVARRFGVPVIDNTPLAERLGTLGEEQEIPPELYLDVAQLLLNNSRGKGAGEGPESGDG